FDVVCVGVSRARACHAPAFVLLVVKLTSTPVTATLSLHDALPICNLQESSFCQAVIQVTLHKIFQRFVDVTPDFDAVQQIQLAQDRKSTRLNSSHVKISYAVFCLKKKKMNYPTPVFTLRDYAQPQE